MMRLTIKVLDSHADLEPEDSCASGTSVPCLLHADTSASHAMPGPAMADEDESQASILDCCARGSTTLASPAAAPHSHCRGKVDLGLMCSSPTAEQAPPERVQQQSPQQGSQAKPANPQSAATNDAKHAEAAAPHVSAPSSSPLKDLPSSQLPTLPSHSSATSQQPAMACTGCPATKVAPRFTVAHTKLCTSTHLRILQ